LKFQNHRKNPFDNPFSAIMIAQPVDSSIIMSHTTNSPNNRQTTVNSQSLVLSSTAIMKNEEHQYHFQNQTMHHHHWYHSMSYSSQPGNDVSTRPHRPEVQQRRFPYYNYLQTWTGHSYQPPSLSSMSDSNRESWTESTPQQRHHFTPRREQTLPGRERSLAPQPYDTNISSYSTKSLEGTHPTMLSSTYPSSVSSDFVVNVISKRNLVCTCKKSK
jgi:hypothetical protein